MSSSPSSILYGGPKPWPAFSPVNDTIRGGKSSSSFRVISEGGRENVGRFEGTLDITALDGAGFASQSTTYPSPRLNFLPSKHCGLRLTFLRPPPSAFPSEEKTLSVLPPVAPHVFTLALKNEEPGRREDGRRESVTVYEYDFDVLKASEEAEKGTVDEEKSAGGRDEVSVTARWGDFKPTYRGRPKEDAKPFDPSSMYELSLMSRSLFGHQAGPFSLSLLSVSLVPHAPSRSRLGWLAAWWAVVSGLLRGWKEWLEGLLGRGERGAVRLP
ncbi:hypothetical protein JCM8097_000311 [Rhodosporidiobolus ruineniae]